MLVSNLQTKTTLFQTLEEMGLLFTDDYYVRTNRQSIYDTMSINVPISNDAIYVPAESGYRTIINDVVYQVTGEISFYNSIVTIHKCEHPDYDRSAVEIWVGNEYIPQAEIEWIETPVYDHAILPKRYDEYDKDGERCMAYVRAYTGVFKRYSVKAAQEGNNYHIETIDFTEPGANLVKNPYNCTFYYTDGALKIPDPSMITMVRDNVYQYKIPYNSTLDIFWCWSLVSTHVAQANVSFNLHSPEAHVVYPRILVDGSELYPIDTKFYPTVRVDKDCVVRVFDDRALEVPCPEASRLLLYPEFADVADPYDTDNEYLNNLQPCDTCIDDTDNDSDVLTKFRQLAPYCYRMGDYFPIFTEQSDFLQLGNYNWDKPYIELCTITRSNGVEEEVLRFLAPYEGHRDILLYNGWIYSEYEVVKLDDDLHERETGTPCYVIHDLDLDMDRLILLKFNTNEDTVINNVGEWIDPNNILLLHYKLNKLYRNLLILRGSVLDPTPDDSVWVGTVPPTNPDTEHTWMELLLNVEPMEFGNNPIDVIRSQGLDPENMPRELVRGMLSLDLQPDGGPTNYRDIVMVYFNYEQRLQDRLVLEAQYDGHIDTQIEYDSLKVGQLPDTARPNDIVLEDHDAGPGFEIGEYYTGDGEPASETYDAGDVYMNIPEAGHVFFAEDGTTIEMAEIASLGIDEKRDLVLSYITNGTDEEIAAMRQEWLHYLDSMDERELNILTYRVMLTDYFYNNYNSSGRLVGDEVPKEEAIHHNVKLIMSERIPDNLTPDTTWFQVPVITPQDFIYDMICRPMFESGAYELPEGEHEAPSSEEDIGTVVFDYMPHGTHPDELELFKEVRDDTLHKVHYGKNPTEEPEDGAVWYEFLEDVHNRICYSDETSMVLNINERLILLEFEHDNITAFAFDDILMNFKGRLGLRYLSIVADLLNSGVITKDQINVFYRRLITGDDEFDPGIKRFYNGRSHVVATCDVDTSDLGILYSTNIGRFHIEYKDERVTNDEREWAWRHVIDYRKMDTAFIPDRMLLFVNGRLISPTDYVDGMVELPVEDLGTLSNANVDPNNLLLLDLGTGITVPFITSSWYDQLSATEPEASVPDNLRLRLPISGMLQLTNFDEVIDNVDIFYSTKDIPLSQLKHIAISCWNGPIPYVRMISHTDRDYGKFVPIINRKYTNRGFYDILLDEYVLNGRLLRYLDYLKDHPDEFEDFRSQMISSFHTISDRDYTDGEHDWYQDGFMSRIVIPGFGTGQVYQIGKPS